MLARYKHLSNKYTQYAEDVVSGKITAGRYVILACQRYLDWFDREDLYFNAELFDKIEDFINHLKHFEGDFAGRPFTLLPW
jgi:phage terminase large subunit-like protein